MYVKEDLFVYLSEEEKLSFKKDSLIWYQPNIIYGDWYGGPNGDGTYTLETQIDTTEVCFHEYSLLFYINRYNEFPHFVFDIPVF
ncbi:UNVERIFIED_CONTAM: hypothetical protein NCL1_40595 [Trichonephila clavipes]